ncbi:phosphotransferase [Paenibacillus sp. MMS18-CY102]|uniref:phosphotransferase n=1 Tax=Paenibacillus sp. MMS18-CY102 TaxID=2682849 RepID=UPI001365BE38|nr:phosphotransferase [Paenibacillus sp. MMS18-CY102]MWC28138.1 phosphotransferase [Paenibacillus sp. MMS18-CY102]
MAETAYNLQFEILCNNLQLGEITAVPEAVSGGLMHKMYAVQTKKGKYAIKALNPQIMLRQTALQNYLNSEKIANVASRHVPALAAKAFNGIFMHNIANQFYLIFDWIEGVSLKSDELDIINCEKMGRMLADIHRADFAGLGLAKEGASRSSLTDWNFYLKKGKQHHSVWLSQLQQHLDQLEDWNAIAISSAIQLESDMVISHRDLEPKNVMWKQGNPILIDWESAGYINPMQDLTETAIYWSSDDSGNIDKEKFMAFISGYKSKYGTLRANWRIVLANGFLGKLDWLEYSLKRSLGIECTDIEDQKVGTSQVIGTLDALVQYADRITEIEQWLNESDA